MKTQARFLVWELLDDLVSYYEQDAGKKLEEFLKSEKEALEKKKKKGQEKDQKGQE